MMSDLPPLLRGIGPYGPYGPEAAIVNRHGANLGAFGSLTHLLK
jgi:hypothetical protein